VSGSKKAAPLKLLRRPFESAQWRCLHGLAAPIGPVGKRRSRTHAQTPPACRCQRRHEDPRGVGHAPQQSSASHQSSRTRSAPGSRPPGKASERCSESSQSPEWSAGGQRRRVKRCSESSQSQNGRQLAKGAREAILTICVCKRITKSEDTDGQKGCSRYERNEPVGAEGELSRRPGSRLCQRRLRESDHDLVPSATLAA
jgi:hypothetical protein